jgi:hypothetical protein
VRLAPVKIQIFTHEWVHMRIALLDSLILDRTAKRSLQRQLCRKLKRFIQRGALAGRSAGESRLRRASAYALRRPASSLVPATPRSSRPPCADR